MYCLLLLWCPAHCDEGLERQGLVENEQQLQEQDGTGQRQQQMLDKQHGYANTQLHAAEGDAAATVAAVVQQAPPVAVCDVAHALPHDAAAGGDEAANQVLASAAAHMQGQPHVMPLEQQQQMSVSTPKSRSRKQMTSI